MSLTRLLLLPACALSMSLSLSSCGTGRVDVVNPTVAEQDQLDVQWGLEPRKSKGGPRRTFQYMDTGSTSAALAPAAAAAPALAPATPAPAPALIEPEVPAPAPRAVPPALR